MPVAVEPLEDRRHFSASPRVNAAAAVPPITIVLGPTGTLAVNGTARDDDIRFVQTGIDTAEVVAFVPVAAGTTAAAPAYTLGTGDRPVPVAVQTITNSAGTTLKMSAAIDLTHVNYVQVNGGAGADTLRETAVVRPANTTGVERTLLSPTTAPRGDTPSDPGSGRRVKSSAAWKAYFQEELATANASTATTAFFGDSHVERWNQVGIGSWKRYFPDALDLGIGGDGTRQLLYRIKAGLFDAFKPKTVVLLIGHNNLNDLTTGTDAQIEAGIQTVIKALQAKIAGVKIVQLGILPRRLAGFNTRIQDINSRSAAAADGKNVVFLDLYARFAGTSEEHPVNETLYDSFDEHLAAAGYKVLSYYLAPLLAKARRTA